uniref:BTB domain-containing protein n=1 Tax=Setaria digitata TaxID=48799 RepID=A0A915PZ66_9BILA
MDEEFGHEIQQAVLQLICRFVRYKGTKRIGRQLAGSNGVGVLLDCFLEGQCESYIVEMCNASFELREQFETPSCITKIVETHPRPEYMLKMLLCFAQDSWGRAALRGHGALDILVDGLEKANSVQQILIVNTLRYFVHDGSGLSYLTFSTRFLDIVVDHINFYLDGSRRMCSMLSGRAVEECTAHNSTGRRKIDCLCCKMMVGSGLFLQNFRLAKDEEMRINMLMPFHSTNLEVLTHVVDPDSFPSKRFVEFSWSPSQSPPPGMRSPLISPTSLMDEYIECMERPTSTNDSPNYVNRPVHTSIKNTELVVGELYILAWLSHSESNMKRLVTSKIVSTLLRYISEAPSMVSKAPRTIRRIFRHRLAVENLSRLELHTLVIHILMTRKCRSGRRISQCSECAIRCDFGNALLEEFSSHIDAPFGLEVLKNIYKSNDEIEQMKACIATLHLVRRIDNWKRMLLTHKPVERLLAKLREMLVDSNYEENWQITTYSEGQKYVQPYRRTSLLPWQTASFSRNMYNRIGVQPTLIRQILVALSFLVPSDVLTNSLYAMWGDISSYINRDITQSKCVVKETILSSRKTMSAASGSPEFIKFKCGKSMEVVPKKCLCEGSEYFRGMFGNGFSEQFRDTFEFNEEEEQCSFRLFSTFLHYLCGCGKSCLRIAEIDIPALLKLSDRYLCTGISSKLLAYESPLRNLINGETLPNYLEVMLSTGSDTCNVLRDACISCLIRCCTEEQMFKALNIVAGNPVAVDALMETLQRFLMAYCRRRKIKYEDAAAP